MNNFVSLSYATPDQSSIRAEQSDSGLVTFIPAVEGNSDYDQLVAMGTAIASYEEPELGPELTPEEKLARSGLTVDELKDVLGL